MESETSIAYRRTCKELEQRICKGCTYLDECPHADLPFTDRDLLYVWSIWCTVQTQLRTSFGGVVGLDYTAVFETCKIYEWEITPWDLEGLQALEYDVLQSQAEKTKNTKAK